MNDHKGRRFLPRNKQYTRDLNVSGKTQWEMETQDYNMADNNPNADNNADSVYQSLPINFKPSAAILEYLTEYQQIPEEFVSMQLIEFKLYWHETKEKRKAWHSRFKSYVIYQWKKHQSETDRTTYKTTFERLTDYEWAKGFSIKE